MTVFRVHVVLAAALALSGAWDATARAQDQPVVTRGTVKVRSRVFNPFQIGQSRITLNPFGIFTVTNSSPFATSTATTTTASPEAATSSALVVDPSVGGSEGSEIATNAVRPPFRPPTRSPWRPPPRPPFIPP